MGWDADPSWKSKADVISEITAPGRYGPGTSVLALRPDWSGAWIVWSGPTTPWIERALIKRRRGGYAVKTFGEETGLDDLMCPVEFFDLAPVPPGPYAAAWRERVKGAA